MTCRWNLQDGQPQLAVAAQMSTRALDAARERPSASGLGHGRLGRGARAAAEAVRPRERRHRPVARRRRRRRARRSPTRGTTSSTSTRRSASPGDPCKQKIADGGIRIVTRTSRHAAARGQAGAPARRGGRRIAYVPATSARTAAPRRAPATSCRSWTPRAEPGGPGLRARVPARDRALRQRARGSTTLSGPHDRISWFSATDGTKLGSVLVSPQAAPQLVASDRVIVYRVGRLLRDVSTRTGHLREARETGANYVGLSLARDRLALGREPQPHRPPPRARVG